MDVTWDTLVISIFDDKFGDARSDIARQIERGNGSYSEPLNEHILAADRAFEITAIALGEASFGRPSVSKRVTQNLLTQIAHDNRAIRLLVTHGFPYQAVTISVSSFEHGMMIGSIGDDNDRAQKWLDHPNLSQNLDSVKKLIELTMAKLETSFPGISAGLGDPYDKVYKPLCAIKHGNPIPQQHMNQEGSLPYSILAPANRRSNLAGMWALEGVIRATWIGLISFIPHHARQQDETSQMVRGLNLASSRIMQVREALEITPND